MTGTHARGAASRSNEERAPRCPSVEVASHRPPASYSSSTTYSRPNANGVQHMFLCRVVVGEYCLGKRDALTPDVRQGHQLYDSTVNNMSDPGMYVTFHDSQAYPEYLIKFKQ